jgi:hypothetical protein
MHGIKVVSGTNFSDLDPTWQNYAHNAAIKGTLEAVDLLTLTLQRLRTN